MSPFAEFRDDSFSETPVRGFLHRAKAADADDLAADGRVGEGLVLTHGAGANCQSPLLIAIAEDFCASGITVLRCDLPFRQKRPHGPPPPGSAERDQAGLRAAISALKSEANGRLFLGGHSYGGRQASMLAAAEPGLVEGLLLLSYPLHPPKRPAELRTKHFPHLETPALFVHGARDGFGSPAELEEALKLIPARTAILPIPSAGHELLTKQNRDHLPRLVIDAFRAFANPESPQSAPPRLVP